MMLNASWLRLKQAVEETLAELERSASRIEFEFDAALAGIFRAHGMMLRDLFASGELERELRTSLVTAETAVRRVFRRWHQKFEALENQTFRERADDVLDLGRNIIRRLRGVEDVGPAIHSRAQCVSRRAAIAVGRCATTEGQCDRHRRRILGARIARGTAGT